MEPILDQIHQQAPCYDGHGTIEMELQEDVAAELDEFLLLSRMGLYTQALNLVNDVLWKHIHHFPVFAEIAAYLVRKAKLKAVQNLVCDVVTRRITFEEQDERAYLRAVALAGRERLATQTLQLLNRGYKKHDRANAKHDADCYDAVLLLKPNLDSTVQVQNVEMRLSAIEVVHPNNQAKLKNYAIFLFGLLMRQGKQGMVREAVSVFCTFCRYWPLALLSRSQLRKMYLEIMASLGVNEPRSDVASSKTDCVEETTIFKLEATVAYMKYAVAINDKDKNLADLVSDVDALLDQVFSDATTPKTESRHYRHLMEAKRFIRSKEPPSYSAYSLEIQEKTSQAPLSPPTSGNLPAKSTEDKEKLLGALWPPRTPDDQTKTMHKEKNPVCDISHVLSHLDDTSLSYHDLQDAVRMLYKEKRDLLKDVEMYAKLMKEMQKVSLDQASSGRVYPLSPTESPLKTPARNKQRRSEESPSELRKRRLMARNQKPHVEEKPPLFGQHKTSPVTNTPSKQSLWRDVLRRHRLPREKLSGVATVAM